MLILNFSPFPVLSTERLTLRQVISTDAPNLFLLRSDKEVMRYIDRPLQTTIQDALLLIQKINDSLVIDESITWALTLKNSPTLIGTIGFWRIEKEHYRAEIGYLLHPFFQGKGIMHEAIRAVLSYGFKTMHLHSVVANVNPDNSTSIKLLERNNFIREGYFKESYFFDGRFLDSAMYSLLTTEK